MAGAANSSGGSGSGPINGINVTPLVDVMLVLLVIFMVTAKLVVAPTSALGVQLPKAASGDAVQVVFSLQLTKEGGRFVDGKSVDSDDSIRALAEAALALHPDLRAVIQADGDVPHRRVIHAMDLLAKAQITNIAFAVEPDAADTASTNSAGAGAPRADPPAAASAPSAVPSP